jgi:hypothetical protein
MTPGYGAIDRDYARQLATTHAQDDGPIWMVNLMRYRERARYDDGSDAGRSGREADDAYAPFDILSDIGAEITFVADVEVQALGAGPAWDRIAVVRYPTRRSFIEMQSRPDFTQRHTHKEAGMASTIVMGCTPFSVPDMPDGIAATDWESVPHPPSHDDGPMMVVHVLSFHDPDGAHSTPDHMSAYQQVAAESAAAHGIRIAGWYAVEGTIVGDGRMWHQVRFNEFPSRRAFLAVVNDPRRREAQSVHREAAIADTYTLMTRATLDVRSPEEHVLP